MLGNFRLKLIAIFFAVALWSVVAYASNPTQSKTYRMPVGQQNVPAGLVIVGNPPQTNVTVTGTSENLQKFDAKGLRVTGNFSNVKVGNNHVPIHVANADPSVWVDAPSTIPVKIDDLGSATLNVTLQRTHALIPGIHEETNATTITPSTVRVDGPKSQLAGLQAIVPFDLAVAAAGSGTINTTYGVTILDADKKPVTTKFTVTPGQVTVKMVIQADAITVTKAVGFTITGQPAAGYRVSNVTITPLQVQATGLPNALSQIPILQTDPVDITNQKADVVRTVNIRPPNGVETNQKTATVHVFISQAPGVSPSSSPAP